jgi:hypothetical protein
MSTVALASSGWPIRRASNGHALEPPRRKFCDVAEATSSRVATEAMRRIGELYEIEARIRGQSHAKGLAECRTFSEPIVDSLNTNLATRTVQETLGPCFHIDMKASSRSITNCFASISGDARRRSRMVARSAASAGIFSEVLTAIST